MIGLFKKKPEKKLTEWNENDTMRAANLLIKTLQRKNLTLALAESVTCGLAAQRLSLVKGTTDVLQGAIICYDVKVKCRLLNVSQSSIKKFSAESQQVTDQLAKNLNKVIEANVYGALTGLAAEGGSETKSKPVGTVFFSVYYEGKLRRKKKVFRGSPLEIQKKACDEFYHFVIEVVQ